MLQNLFDDGLFLDDANDAHSSTAFWAQERVYLIDFWMSRARFRRNSFLLTSGSLFLLPWLVLAEFAVLAWAAGEGRLREKTASYFAALEMLPKIRRKRRALRTLNPFSDAMLRDVIGPRIVPPQGNNAIFSPCNYFSKAVFPLVLLVWPSSSPKFLGSTHRKC